MPSYRAAAQRHQNDADYLHANGRLPNADHLYGLAAECALKAVMHGLGMPMNPAGTIPQMPYRVHVNRLWQEFHTFMAGQIGVTYATQIPSINPFWDWTVDDRYEDGVRSQPSVVQTHQSGARAALSCMNQAFLDGVIR